MMNSRFRTRIALRIAVGLGPLLWNMPAAATVQNAPNVVVIIADDMGYSDLGFLPHAPEDVKAFGTPGLDRLAGSGTYFENAYATSPICSPSRTGLITGRYQQRWGNYWYGQGGLPESEGTLPEALLKLGYTTAKLGKNHLNGGAKEFPNRHGFETFLGFLHHTWDYIRLSHKDREAYQNRDGFNGFGSQVVGPLVKADGLGKSARETEEVSYENSFTTTLFTDEACSYIERNKNSAKPFYLHVAYNALHQPTYVTEKSWAEKTGARHVPWDRTAAEWVYPYWEPSREPNKKFHARWGHMGEVDPVGDVEQLAGEVAGLAHAR